MSHHQLTNRFQQQQLISIFMLGRLNKTIKFFASNNHYQTLGISSDSDFTQVRKKYLQKIKTTHPDTSEGDHQKFIQINHAYQILSNPLKRRVYDKTIGVESSRWNEQQFNAASPHFENDQIQRILAVKNQKPKPKIVNPLEVLDIKYRQQVYKTQQKKYMLASLIFPVTAFGLFWLSWEMGETFLLNYKGNTIYQQKASTHGKDLSIVVTQIR